MSRRSMVFILVVATGLLPVFGPPAATGALVGTVFAADPPLLLNYQGVLRDPSDTPQEGSFDMEFAFYDDADDDCGDGVLLLTDRHLAAGTGDIVVSGGLFDVALGGGLVTGAAEATLADVFANHTSVYMEVRVEGGGGGLETLCPRVRVVSTGYALNAQRLAGRAAASFLDLSPAAQTKSGNLTVADLTVNDNTVYFGSGAWLNSSSTLLFIGAGDQDTDLLNLQAGNTGDDGRIILYGGGSMELRAGNGLFRFYNGATGAETATLDPAGNLSLADLSLNGNTLMFGAGSRLESATASLALTTGDADTDSLYLTAGNTADDGRLVINGDGWFEMRSGNGFFSFYNGATGVESAVLDAVGNLQIDGSLNAAGSLRVSDAFMQSLPTQFALFAGDTDTDNLFLSAGNSTDDGGFSILGDGDMQLYAGNGLFKFLNGATAVETAHLDASGSLQVDGSLVASGGTLTLGTSGLVSSTGTGLLVSAGALDSDDLNLRAGNSSLDGQILMNGGGALSMLAGNGLFQFKTGTTGAEVASIDDTGNLQLDGLLDDDLAVTLGFGTVITVQGTAPPVTIAGVNVDINLGDSSADRVDIPGTLLVTGTKNFVQNHPERADLSIFYTALEGDEAGTYTRGSARLADGVARVSLGETFAWVTYPNVGLTAHVTPRGAWADLYVESVTTRELVVRSRDGASAAEFDYIVHGLRIGYEDFPVVQPRDRDRRIPVEGYHAALFAAQPELVRYRPIERFLGTQARVTGGATPGADGGGFDPGPARALRQAIGEHDRDADTLDMKAQGPPPQTASGSLPVAAAPPAAADRATAGIATAALPIDHQGNVYAQSFRPHAGDLASLAEVDGPVEAGDILVIDPDRAGVMRLSRTAADTAVFGIVAAEPGVVLGAAPPGPAADDAAARQENAPSGEPTTGTVQVPVVFSGVLLCKVDASFGAIRPGDLLTTSPTPGHAMRADIAAAGTIVGKALEPLRSGTGHIRILVTLR